MILRCLLIGGFGFIGSHLVKKLIVSGRCVTVLGRKNSSYQEKVAGVTYIKGDFSDAKLLDQLVSEHDEVVHLAYATRPNTSFDNPLADLSQNLSSAVKLFEIVAHYGAKLLLVSSGGTIYGEALLTPISEDHPTQPISPYGVTKLTLEKYAYLYAVTKGLQVVCVRPANPYGENQLPFVGQGFVSTAMATAMQNKEITIYGEHGTIRDYIYVGDLIDGIVTVMDKGEMNEAYNIGSGVGRSNLQVVEAIRPLLADVGIDACVSYEMERPFDVKVNILDSQKIHGLGWAANTAIELGLKKTFSWLRTYLEKNAH